MTTSRRDFLGSLGLGLFASPATARPFQRPTEKAARLGPGCVVARLDAVIEPILAESGIAGASLAIAKDGRLVVARGYGMADVDAKTPVTAATLFSLGSVTKSVSAVAALRLVDQGKLRLEARLVDLLPDLNPPAGQAFADPRFRAITVHHLLYHASGFPRDTVRPRGRPQVEEGDEEGATDDVIRAYKLAMTRPLEFAPGSDHRYSNFGFLVLRLAIERASGQPYETYVREQILGPLGITRMTMETQGYRPGETKRYVAGPNGLRPARHLPHNWLASPTDLVRFLTAASGARNPPLLSKRAHALMIAPPPPPVEPNRNGAHVGLGWDTARKTETGVRFSKDGGKAGVRAWLEHLPDGVDWAVMINTSPEAKSKADADAPETPNAFRTITRRVAETVESIRAWPEIDLFAR